MEDRRRRDIALFRYALAREAADPSLSGRDRGAIVRALADMEHVGPDGRPVRVARSTLDRWVRAYRADGYDALVPAARQVAARTPEAVLGLAETLKRERPERTAAQVRRVMAEAGTADVCSERTLQRHFARLGLKRSGQPGTPRVYGRFEAAAPNERWHGDAMHGPAVGGRKAYLLAFLDDHSRLATGYRWTFSEDTVRMESALRAGVSSRGVPKDLIVDWGSAYRDAQLARACAVLGIRLVHAKPRTPTTKGKVERWFETVRAQFVVELDPGAVADLAGLNRLFSAWVETVYHRRVHTETGATPLERFLAGGPPGLPSAALMHEAFLWSESRLVNPKTATVNLHGNVLEVDASLVGRRVDLVFNPFDLATVEVRYQGRPMGMAVAQHIGRHTHPKARPEAQPPPVPTGIEYLELLAARRDAELTGRRIAYTAVAPTATFEDPDHREDQP